MKRFTALFFVLLIAAFLLVPVVHAAPVAAPVMQESAPDIFSIIKMLEELAKTGATLTGFALFYAAFINAGKYAKPEWFPDASAPTYNLIFQSITLTLLVIFQVTGRTDLVPLFDKAAGLLATILGSVVALVYQLWVSRMGHNDVLAGTPVIGTSYSGRQAGNSIFIEEYSE
jgi:hypothetical protein